MQLVCIFLAQILLHTFYKSSLSTAQIKVHQIPHFIFQIKSLFFFKVLRDNSSVLFLQKRYMLLTELVHQSANFQTFHCLH